MRVLLCIQIIAIILLFYYNIFPSFAGGKNKDLSYLILKRVETNLSSFSETAYVKGKELYPEYSYHGLPENFLIKKTPDVTIDPKGIRMVEIRKMRFAPVNMPAYTIIFHFNTSTAIKIRNYTKENLNTHVALEVDGKIFVIAKILDVVENKLNISVAKKDINEIKCTVRKISRKIIIDKELERP